MKPSLIFAFCLAVLVALTGCDSTAQEARPVTLVNDTDYLIVYTIRHPLMRSPEYGFPQAIDDINDIKSPFKLVLPQTTFDIENCAYRDFHPNGNLNNAWIINIYKYRLSPSDNSAQRISNYRFGSVDDVIDTLAKTGCQIRMSNTKYLRQLMEMSSP